MGAKYLRRYLLNNAKKINIFRECRGLRVGLDLMTEMYPILQTQAMKHALELGDDAGWEARSC